MTIGNYEKEIWRVAMTLANNICIQESDRHNQEDELEEAKTASYCAKRIRDWMELDEIQLKELLKEGGAID